MKKHLLGGEIARPIERAFERRPRSRTKVSMRRATSASSRASSIEAARPGSIAASSTCGRVATTSARRGALPRISANNSRKRALRAQDREQLYRRRHAPQRRVERGDSAASGSPEPAKASSSAGVSSVSTSRARALRMAARRRNASRGSSPRPARAAKAEASAGRQGRGIVDDAREDEIADAGVKPGRVLEQPRIVRLHLRAIVWSSRAANASTPRIAAELSEARQRLGLERQTLRLLVGDHLQAMFDAAEVCVGVGKLLDGFRADPFVGAQFARACRACARRACADDGRRKLAAASARKTRSRGCRRGRA